MRAGLPRDLLRPLNSDGNLRANSRGSHRGHAEALNVEGAQPGYVYYWARHPKRDRGGAQLQRFLNQGWEVVPPDAPERKSRETSLDYAALGLDGYQAHGDVLLLRIPEEHYRTIAELRQHQAKVAFEGVTDEYLEKSRDLQERFGERADGPVYFRASGHGTSSE